MIYCSIANLSIVTLRNKKKLSVLLKLWSIQRNFKGRTAALIS